MTEYVVQGPQAVHEVEPGGNVTLDPNDPETERLLERGQIVKKSDAKKE